MKKKAKNSAVVESTTTETAVVANTTAPIVNITLPKGRPTNPHSARQIKLAAMEAKKQAAGGELHRGRPVNPDSARQKKLLTKGASKTGAQGRPVNPDSVRQKQLAARAEKLAAYIASQAK
jgi:hypothetical protein